jgi:hypothetical protein
VAFKIACRTDNISITIHSTGIKMIPDKLADTQENVA